MGRESFLDKEGAEDFDDDFFYDDETSVEDEEEGKEKTLKRAIFNINSADRMIRKQAMSDISALIEECYTPALIWSGNTLEKMKNYERAAESFKLAGNCGDKEGARKYLDLAENHLNELALKTSELEGMAKIIIGEEPAPVVLNLYGISMGWEEKNESLLDKFIGDSQMGLVREKPIFVAGRLQRQYYVKQLALRGGEHVSWHRLGSTECEGINGAIDVFEGIRANGESCGRIYICIYATHKPKTYDIAPAGYEVDYRAVFARLFLAIQLHESGKEEVIRDQVVGKVAKLLAGKKKTEELSLITDVDGVTRWVPVRKTEYGGPDTLRREAISQKKVKREKKENQSAQKKTYGSDNIDEFTADVRNLLDRNDVQSKKDIYRIEFDKTRKLIDSKSNSDMARARAILDHLEELSYIPAIMLRAHMYESAEDERYYPEAAKRFKKAADLGDGDGARCYADMRMIGKGIKKDQHDAIRYYAMAADKGIPEATFVIGEYFRNRGDKKHALKAYKEAYAEGYELAQVRIRQLKSEG